jgi:hypothetical protein
MMQLFQGSHRRRRCKLHIEPSLGQLPVSPSYLLVVYGQDSSLGLPDSCQNLFAPHRMRDTDAFSQRLTFFHRAHLVGALTVGLVEGS